MIGKGKIKIIVIKEGVGYSATTTIGSDFITAESDTFDNLKISILQAINFAFEEDGTTYDIEDLNFEFDLESFFDFYRVINAKALSERIGMNQSLLAQYIRGIKKPSPAQIRRILQGVQQIGRELTEVRFLI